MNNLVQEFLKNRENYKNFAISRSKIINDPITRALRAIKNRDPKPFNHTEGIVFHSDY